MKRLITLLSAKNYLHKEQPLMVKDIITTQKELVRQGYPFIPESFLEFLQNFNGVSASDSAILGIPPIKREELDILAFNHHFNNTHNMTIIAYDDSCFLVFDNNKKMYCLLDRSSSMLLEEYEQDELVYALNDILHLDND